MKLSTKVKSIIKGAMTSWTINWAMLSVALGGLEQYSGIISSLIGKENGGILLMVAGLVSAMLRAKTNQSLEAKGSK